jgi:hypothetical protein
MVYLDSTLCLEYSELVPVVMNRDNFYHHRGNGNLVTHGVGGNGRNVLIEYESMPHKYKDAAKEYYGCPYIYASKQPILQSLEFDNKAQAYYQGYSLPNGTKLPSSNFNLNGKKQINYVQRYTECATWLNMLIRLINDKTALKRELNISVGKFWETACDMIKTKKVNLPATPKRLKIKIKDYQLGGYEALIEKHKFGNSYSKKVVGEVAEALLKQLLSLRNKHADTTITEEYNKWAISEGLKPITPEAVGYWRKKWHNELILERDGISKTYTKLSKQGKRKRPSAPLLLINSDDNVMDIYFKAPSTDWFRPVLYVVIDTFNDYILGYAMGASVTKELVKEAYRNANRHVMELTGASYSWQQLQTDRWALDAKQTTEIGQFYKSMGVSTPAGLNNSQAKYVERSFGTVWHTMLKKLFPNNYSGHNLTAKQKLNPDQLKPAYFPLIDDAAEQVDLFIQAMRQTKRTKCDLTRQQEWLKAFNESPKSQSKLLSPEMRLQIFGKRHNYTNRITSSGLTPTLLGKERVYELKQATIFEHIDKQVQIIYDDKDLSTVLVTDGKGLRFLASEYKLLPSAIADYEIGDKKRIENLLLEKKTLQPIIQARIESRKEVLQRAQINAESRLQAGVLVKEITHKDQMLITAANNGAAVDAKVDNDEAVDIYASILNRD